MFPELQQLASVAAAQAASGGCEGGQGQLLLPIILFAILYFVWLRPASKERKDHAEMLKNLKRGDRVITTSGMLGTIADKSETTVTLEVSRNVKIEMVKSAVAKRVKAETALSKKEAAPSKKEAAEPAKKKG